MDEFSLKLVNAAKFSLPPEVVDYISRRGSAWVEHTPFAYWLIDRIRPEIFVELGTHHGCSYFSFCESVKQNGLETKCFAVDTWQGDGVTTGHYSHSIFDEVSSYNAEYSSFSTLLRMDFDSALNKIADKSVRLLHIDGCHSYEAVKHDFDTWLPKLGSDAVVLFHDTEVMLETFGVWKLWAELKQQYPNSLEFLYAAGLGVLFVNPTQPVFWEELSADDKETFLGFFENLGFLQRRHCEAQMAKLLAVTALENEDTCKKLEEKNARLENANAQLEQKSKKLEAEAVHSAQVIRSAMKWQNRSWIKRLFHKWRPPTVA